MEFFLLPNLVSYGFDSVRIFMHFDDFTAPSVPKDLDAHVQYRKRSIAFVTARPPLGRGWDLFHIAVWLSERSAGRGIGDGVDRLGNWALGQR